MNAGWAKPRIPAIYEYTEDSHHEHELAAHGVQRSAGRGEAAFPG